MVMPSIEVKSIGVEDWRLWRHLRLSALEESPDSFDSTLEQWSGQNDTEDRWRARLEALPLNVVAYLNDQPAGMVSAIDYTDRIVMLNSLWVAPWARGTGTGDRLVEAVIEWARHQLASEVALEVRRANARAIALYERHRFRILDTTSELDHFEPNCEGELAMVCELNG
jgi:ribosomal protein S18 acetylase RimI-like enzyme